MTFRFGLYTLDAATRDLSQDGEHVDTGPKVFDFLHLLIANRQRVVTKDELVEELWQGRAISDAALSTCVKSARRAIGDDGERQELIKTVHGRGFRFVGDVTETAAAEPAEAAPAPPAESEVADLDLTLPSRPSVAVLPFATAARHGPEAFLADGLGRDIHVRLARTRWLFVAARASAVHLTVPGLDPVEIGVRLGVRYVLQGALQSGGDRLRLSVTLSDVVQGATIWAEIFDRRVEDVFEVQEEISDAVAAIVESEIELKERQRALLRPLASLDAWSAYHRASDHLYRFSRTDFDEAERFLRIAGDLDPTSSRVAASRSFLHWQRAFLEWTDDRDGELARSFEFAHRSVELDPLDPQGHWVLGRAHILGGNMAEAVPELKRSVELNPNFANGQYSVAFGVTFDGRSDEGFAFVDAARRLSPYDPMTFAYFMQRAVMSGLTGKTEAAATWADRGVRMPNAHYHLHTIAAWCNELDGRHETAAEHVARLRKVRPDYTRDDYFRAFPYCERDRTTIANVLSRLGF